MKILLIFAIAALIFLGCIFYMLDSGGRIERQREMEWLAFSKANRCKIVHEAGFWDAASTWQCDGGFQVKHQ